MGQNSGSGIVRKVLDEGGSVRLVTDEHFILEGGTVEVHLHADENLWGFRVGYVSTYGNVTGSFAGEVIGYDDELGGTLAEKVAEAVG